ncbi:hypothetical protein GGR52DRAFT_576017 [Hypoxylon sp. FL1284]|nr:hypothetical protein GGR52DRAFT_576017 [Hypoxylon sp. FL1284]
MFSRLIATVCAVAPLLPWLAFASPIPEVGENKDNDLAVSPRAGPNGRATMKEFGYYFRGTTDIEEAKNGKFPPQSCYDNPGDFAPKGHLGMYFWATKSDAKEWCEDMYGGQACYIVEYEWSPPGLLELYQWPYLPNEQDYSAFVTHNWNSPDVDGSFAKYEVIEGPMSVKINGVRQPSLVDYQYCIVRDDTLKYLTWVGAWQVQ